MHSQSALLTLKLCLNTADLLHMLTAYQWDLICGQICHEHLPKETDIYTFSAALMFEVKD